MVNIKVFEERKVRTVWDDTPYLAWRRSPQDLSVVPDLGRYFSTRNKLDRNGEVASSSLVLRLLFLLNHTVQSPSLPRLLIDAKAMSKRSSIEDLSNIYRTSIEVLSNAFCFQLTYPRRFIALQNALTKSDPGISFLNFVIIACFLHCLTKLKRVKAPTASLWVVPRRTRRVRLSSQKWPRPSEIGTKSNAHSVLARESIEPMT